MPEMLLNDYLPLVIFIGLSLVIGLALLVAPFIVGSISSTMPA
jgi:NADH-quinone oxidoreductase subunit A